MNPRPLTWTALLFAAMASACLAQGTSSPALDRHALVGTWRLVSVESLRPGGEVSREWMGSKPTGLLMYDATGHMSVQIMRDPRPTFDSGRDRPRTPEEFKAAYDGYYAYFGTYELNEAEGIILHRVQASLWPREVGREYRRHINLSSDRLTLTTPPIKVAGEQRINSLAWERVK